MKLRVENREITYKRKAPQKRGALIYKFKSEQSVTSSFDHAAYSDGKHRRLVITRILKTKGLCIETVNTE